MSETTETLTGDVKPSLNKRQLFVRGLPGDATEDEVETHFSACGPVRRAVLIREKRDEKPGAGRSQPERGGAVLPCTGVAFVSYALESDAAAALEQLRDRMFRKSHRLTLDYAVQRLRLPRGLAQEDRGLIEADRSKLAKVRRSEQRLALAADGAGQGRAKKLAAVVGDAAPSGDGVASGNAVAATPAVGVASSTPSSHAGRGNANGSGASAAGRFGSAAVPALAMQLRTVMVEGLKATPVTKRVLTRECQQFLKKERQRMQLAAANEGRRPPPARLEDVQLGEPGGSSGASATRLVLSSAGVAQRVQQHFNNLTLRKMLLRAYLAADAASAQQREQRRRLILRNLPFKCTEADLRIVVEARLKIVPSEDEPTDEDGAEGKGADGSAAKKRKKKKGAEAAPEPSSAGPPVPVLEELKMPVDQQGRPRGFAFIRLPSVAAASRAMKQLNGMVMNKRPIVVDWAAPRNEYLAAKEKQQQEQEQQQHDQELQQEQQPKTLSKGKKNKKNDDSGSGSGNSEGDEKDAGGQSSNSNSSSSSSSSSSNDDEVESEASDNDDSSNSSSSNVASDLSDQSSSSGSSSDSGSEGSDDEAEVDDDGDEEEEEEEEQEIKYILDTVFVRQVNPLVDEATLADVFSQWGPVKYAKVVRDSETGTSRGSAFVAFHDALAADAAIQAYQEEQGAKGGGVTVSKFAPLGARPVLNRAVDRATVGAMEKKRSAERKRGNRSAGAGDAASAGLKKNLHLLTEGLVVRGTPEARLLSAEELRRREQAHHLKKRKLESPNFYVSDRRLSIRQIPKWLTAQDLRRLFRNAAVQGVKAAGSEGQGASEADVRLTQAKVVAGQKNASVKGAAAQKLVSKGFGFVEFADPAHALAALRHANRDPKFWPTRDNAGSKDAAASAKPGSKKRKQKAGPGGDGDGDGDGDHAKSPLRPIVEFAIEDVRALHIQKQRRIKQSGRGGQSQEGSTGAGAGATGSSSSRPGRGGEKSMTAAAKKKGRWSKKRKVEQKNWKKKSAKKSRRS